VNADDPLLPPPATWFAGPAEAQEGSDPLQVAFNAVVDYFAFNAIAMPALDNGGRPVVPPDEHVLDHLARAWDLVDPDEASLRPGADTVHVTDEVFACDGCHHNTARYDALLTANDGQSFGAFLCPQCLRRRRATTLGAGHSIYLMTFAEVPPTVRAVVDELCRRMGRAQIWPEQPPAGWRREYYRAGFTPDGHRMIRELHQRTLVATNSGAGTVHLEVRRYIPELRFTEQDDFVLPASWTTDQIRSCLLGVFRELTRAPLPAEFEIELTKAEPCTEAALDAGVNPVSLADDALTSGVYFRLPRGDSYLTRCAKVVAARSDQQRLIGRLVLEHPGRAVRELALVSPACPHDVLLTVSGPSHPDLWHVLVRREPLDPEVSDRLTDTALKGATTDPGIVSLAHALVLNPRCRLDAVPALVDRIRHGSKYPAARADLARGVRALPPEHRHAVYTQLLIRTRTGASSDATIDAIIGFDAETPDAVDADELAWLLTHPDRGVRRVAHAYAVARGLAGVATPSPSPSPVGYPSATVAEPPPLNEIAVAVRLRLAWRQIVGPWLESSEHDLGPAWRHCGLRRRGLTLEILSPYDFGEGDPFAGGVKEELARMISSSTDGRVTGVSWSYSGSGPAPQARVRAAERDIFHPGDPVDGEEVAASGIARRLNTAADSPAAKALTALRVAAISSHWIWLVAANEADRDAIGTTPGAGGQLFESIRKLQGRPKPLYSVYTDPVVWERSWPFAR